jgi:hypothetical protein
VRLPDRIYEVLPLVCLRCGGEMRLIAFITPPPLAPRARPPPESGVVFNQALGA